MMVRFETLQQNLRRFNVNRYGTKPSILGGVKRKARAAIMTQCLECSVIWLDKIYGVPHEPCCPNGHYQLKPNGERHVVFDETELGALMQYSLMRDIAAGGELGIRDGFHKDTITSEQFFQSYGFDKDGRVLKRHEMIPGSL